MLYCAEKPKNFPPYLDLSGDFTQVNDSLFADEVRFDKLDDGWLLLARCSRIDTIYEPQRARFSPDTPVCLRFYSGEYEKRKKDGEEWKTIKVQPSPLELYINKVLTELSDLYVGKTFTGKVNLNSSEDLLSKISSPDKFEIFLDITFDLKEVTSPSLLVPYESKAGNGKGGYGGSRGQTEAERLRDRLAFLIELVGAEKPETPNLALSSVHRALEDIKAADPKAFELKMDVVRQLLY